MLRWLWNTTGQWELFVGLANHPHNARNRTNTDIPLVRRATILLFSSFCSGLSLHLRLMQTLLSLILVWCKIRGQENRNLRYSHQQPNSLDRRLSRRFAVQGSLYVGAMWLCNIWSLTNYSLQLVKGKGNAHISMTASVFKPLEGFFNTLIYLR